MRALVSLCVIGALASACASGVTPSAGPPTGTRPIAPSAPAVASATAPATPATSTLATGTVTVQMGDHFYDPARLVVARGTTVVWKNVGITVHDVTSYDGSFRSSTMGPGNTFGYTFARPGRYPYYCTPHAGDGMIGEVIVE